jgi:hypothetical protein
MMRHAEKVETLSKKLASFSKMLIITGVAFAGFAGMCYLENKKVSK